MALIDSLLQTNQANRIVDLERLESKQLVFGDFEGSVTGRWVELDNSGAGVVSYKNKKYKTKPIGFTSLRANTPVQLTHADGIYYSQW